MNSPESSGHAEQPAAVQRVGDRARAVVAGVVEAAVPAAVLVRLVGDPVAGRDHAADGDRQARRRARAGRPAALEHPGDARCGRARPTWRARRRRRRSGRAALEALDGARRCRARRRRRRRCRARAGAAARSRARRGRCALERPRARLSALHVAGPTMPSAVSPWRRWKRLTARLVCLPKMRSTCRPSTFWTKATRGPLAPRLSEPAWAGDAVQSTSASSAAINMRPRLRRVALPTYDSVCCLQIGAYEVSCRARAARATPPIGGDSPPRPRLGRYRFPRSPHPGARRFGGASFYQPKPCSCRISCRITPSGWAARRGRRCRRSCRTAGSPSSARPCVRGARKVSASCSSARARFAPRQ